MEWIESALAQIENAKDLSELEAIRVGILGKKGKLTEEFSRLKSVPNEQKRILQNR